MDSMLNQLADSLKFEIEFDANNVCARGYIAIESRNIENIYKQNAMVIGNAIAS